MERGQSAVNALTVQWGDLTNSLHNSAEFTVKSPHCTVRAFTADWPRSMGLRSDLNGQINKRRDSDEHRSQLPNCRKHFPLHRSFFVLASDKVSHGSGRRKRQTLSSRHSLKSPA